jgi:hypothetical protein
MNWKAFERKRTIPAFAWRNWRKLRNTGIWIADARAEIRTGHLPDTVLPLRQPARPNEEAKGRVAAINVVTSSGQFCHSRSTGHSTEPCAPRDSHSARAAGAWSWVLIQLYPVSGALSSLYLRFWHNREIRSSNFGRDIAYQAFHCLLQFFQAKARIVTQLGHDRSLACPFQFTVLACSNLLTGSWNKP